VKEYPKLSIITPSYNQAAFLEQTIRSVLDQHYPNLEYFVVDGVSTDGSQEIIKKYEKELAWWVSEPDHGQAEAINKGFGRATGEYIAWINSDDLYLPGSFMKATTVFLKNPDMGMVFGDVLAIDSQGRTTNIMRYGDWGIEDLMQFSIIGQPGVFMRREYLEKVKEGEQYLETRYHYLLDHQLWLRIALLAPMQHIKEPLAAGRFHTEAKNVAQAARFGQEAYQVVEWMQSQPAYDRYFSRLGAKIWAGVHRYNARYLLDGGQAGAALRSYWKSLKASPKIALVEWHRMIYALLCLAGLESVKALYYRLRYFVNRKKEPEIYS
jgi:glycosyltransferase involved in cell wall biosynthesis